VNKTQTRDLQHIIRLANQVDRACRKYDKISKRRHKKLTWAEERRVLWALEDADNTICGYRTLLQDAIRRFGELDEVILGVVKLQTTSARSSS
jgi:hypothetical protein